MMIALEPLVIGHSGAVRDRARGGPVGRGGPRRGASRADRRGPGVSLGRGFRDPDQTDLEAVEARLGLLEPGPDAAIEGRLVLIPVLYDGPDLEPVASRLGLQCAEVIALHAAAVYDVFAIGFLQGFPYAGYLPRALCGLRGETNPGSKCRLARWRSQGARPESIPANRLGAGICWAALPCESSMLNTGHSRSGPATGSSFSQSSSRNSRPGVMSNLKPPTDSPGRAIDLNADLGEG